MAIIIIIIIYYPHYVFLQTKSLLICSLHIQFIVSKSKVNFVPCDSVLDIIFLKTMYNKTLILILVFVMSGIIKVSVSFTSLGLLLI